MLTLLPREHLSENEVAAAAIADQRERFNPQQQFRVTWPAEPVVARAYIDQLERSEALSASSVADLNAALDRTESRLEDGAKDAELAESLEMASMALDEVDGDAIANKRRAALSETLVEIAARLR